ncbi:MAG: AhpC/TSA family protein [Bacteroidales bacterium]|nr:AhpC/TSA family protein [Bacteroidales bacterium]
MRICFSKFGGFVLALAAIVLMASCTGKKSDNRYTISGNVPSGVKAEWIYMYDISGAEPVAIDSAHIENGQFKMKGLAPDTLTMTALHPGSLDEYPAVAWTLVLEKGDIIIDTNEQYAMGTPINDGLKDWLEQIEGLFMSGDGPEAIKGFFNEHWQEHSSDFVGAYVLGILSPYMEFAFVDSLAAQIPDDVREISLVKLFFEQLEAIRKMQPGNLFTDVDMKDLEGNAVKLSDYVGKGDYVLVDFWASWCGPCRQATPELQAVVKKFKALKAIGIAVSDELEDTKRAVNDLGIKWTVLSDKEALSAKIYGINAIPAMILFAPDGKIFARDFKVEELDDLLEGVGI